MHILASAPPCVEQRLYVKIVHVCASEWSVCPPFGFYSGSLTVYYTNTRACLLVRSLSPISSPSQHAGLSAWD